MQESPGTKSFWKKNPGNKTFEKSPNFLKSLEKISLKINSCVLDSRDFFPKIVWEMPIKPQEIRSQEKSPEEKKSEEKKILEKRTFSIVHFHLLEDFFCIKSYWSEKKVLKN